MNFTDDFKRHRNIEIWLFQTLFVWVLVLIFTVFCYVCYYATIHNTIEGAILPNDLYFLTIPIACVLSYFISAEKDSDRIIEEKK